MQQINADPEHKQLLNDLLFRNMFLWLRIYLDPVTPHIPSTV